MKAQRIRRRNFYVDSAPVTPTRIEMRNIVCSCYRGHVLARQDRCGGGRVSKSVDAEMRRMCRQWHGGRYTVRPSCCKPSHSWGGIAADKILTARASCVIVDYPQFIMFWILRRTRLTSAAAFFNAINNNNQSSNNATGKSVILYCSSCSRIIKGILEFCYLVFKFFQARSQNSCENRI